VYTVNNIETWVWLYKLWRVTNRVSFFNTHRLPFSADVRLYDPLYWLS